MKKILWFAFGFALIAGFGAIIWNSWQTAVYFQENGREGTLLVGRKYNASIWSSPIPIKKINSYVATLAPDHEVLIESDQSLKDNEEYFVKFLLRETAAEVRSRSIRPLVGTIRLKSEADGTPVRLADTDLFDRIVDKAMGPPAEGTYVRPREVAEAAPRRDVATVPFIFAGANDTAVEIIWNNSGVGEWILAGLWLIAIKMIILHAWVTPLNPGRKSKSERKGFVHPTMRRIEADTPATASAKITYTPKGEDHDYTHPSALPKPPPRRDAIPLPPSAASPSAPRVTPTEPYSTATTAPFVAEGGSSETTLKLTRKPRLPAPDDHGDGSTPTTPPAPPIA